MKYLFCAFIPLLTTACGYRWDDEDQPEPPQVTEVRQEAPKLQVRATYNLAGAIYSRERVAVEKDGIYQLEKEMVLPPQVNGKLRLQVEMPNELRDQTFVVKAIAENDCCAPRVALEVVNLQREDQDSRVFIGMNIVGLGQVGPIERLRRGVNIVVTISTPKSAPELTLKVPVKFPYR